MRTHRPAPTVKNPFDFWSEESSIYVDFTSVVLRILFGPQPRWTWETE